ncbi:RNA polymerase subunit sigma-24, partial [Spirillospora sp. NPDC049652]
APDAVAVGDGGGVVAAMARPIEGAERIAAYMVDVISRAPGMEVAEETVNAQPGLVARNEGGIAAVFAFDVQDGLIKHIWCVRNPDKLRPWTTG